MVVDLQRRGARAVHHGRRTCCVVQYTGCATAAGGPPWPAVSGQRIGLDVGQCAAPCLLRSEQSQGVGARADKVRQQLLAMPTTLYLPPRDVQLLRETGASMVRESPEFQRLMRTISSPTKP